MLRKVLETWGKKLVLKRWLDARFGRRPFFVTPDAGLKYLKSNLNSGHAELFRLAERFVRPGQHVWDVGSNVGIFAIAAAHRVGAEGSVLVVEADPCLAALIQRSACLPENRDRSISVLCAAASSTFGVATFHIAMRARASNSLHAPGSPHAHTQSGGVRYVQPVATLPLDALLDEFPAPSVIKIDVEGAELMAINGCRKVLQVARPIVFLEADKLSSPELVAILREHRYRLFDGDQDPPVAVDQCTYNTLAVPEERLDQVVAK